MLHRLGSIFFLLAIMFYFFKYINIISKKNSLKLHIYAGTLGAVSMILYSILDFIKEKEASILPIGIASFLILISGTEKYRKKYKKLHIVSVILFALSLALHIAI